MPRLAPPVQAVLRRAADDARRRRHAAVTVEHLLRAIAADEVGRRVLLAVKVDVLRLVDDLERYLSEHVPRLRWWHLGPRPDEALYRLLERAALHLFSSEQQELHLGGLLASLFQEEARGAVLLREQGVSRLDLLRQVAHGAGAGRSPASPSAGPHRVVLHNDHYTTMEFVVSVLQRVFDRSPEQANDLMLRVHRQGQGVAGVYPYEIAATKAADVMELAGQAGFPLLSTIEPD